MLAQQRVPPLAGSQRATVAFKPAFKAPVSRRSPLRVVAQAQQTDDVGTAGLVGIATGLISNPVVAYSLYTLKTTGAGLPPGPGGLYGAIEGISFLGVYGIAAWSIYTKVKTGSGLPAGPSGLLGAVEGISFLTVLASIVVFGLEFADKGALPGITG